MYIYIYIYLFIGLSGSTVKSTELIYSLCLECDVVYAKSSKVIAAISCCLLPIP